MFTRDRVIRMLSILLAGAMLLCFSGTGGAVIQGITGPAFTLSANVGEVSTADGNSILVWGYANGAGLMSYPGPTLIVNEGDPVSVTLTNQLTVPTSIVFPGQLGVTASGGQPGLVTREAAASGGTVTYSFTASNPGTYTYHSGTNMELQVEMGMFGVLIVRPAGFVPVTNQTAYGDASTAYDHEYLFITSEMDDRVHDLVAFGRMAEVDNTTFHPVYWFINGRAAPDSLFADNVAWLPHQPLGSIARMHPGETILLRIVGGGRDLHPFHTHGNNFTLIARDGGLLSTDGVVADLGVSDFTQTVGAGETYDALFSWTGRELGWDYYGHDMSLADPAHLPEPGEMTATTFTGGGIGIGAGPGTAIPLSSTAGFPTTHSFRMLAWSSGAATPNEAAAREVIKIAWDGVTDNQWEIVERGLEGTAPQTWAAGDNIALTDHGKPIPVEFPDQKDLFFGGFWSGSPYLGAMGALPPGEGGLNLNGGFFFMWHSHTESELVNNDVFPGGLLSMLIVEAPSVAIP